MSNIRKSTSQFIDDAKRIHCDKYDYSKVEYVNTHTPIKLICRKCDIVFSQEPASHLAGRGCPKCAHKQTHLRINQEQFIERAKKVHGDKYDYSQTAYVNMHTKVTIICPIHGIFLQNPQTHVSGSGCPKCKRDKHIERITKGLPYFLERAHEVHGDKYDYSKVEYVNRQKKVCIICPKHGEFYQSPESHVQGHGCIRCGNSQEKKHLTNNEFIKRAKEIHGNKYDYSKVKYKNSTEKICIICSNHGEFWQRPSEHLKGSGCYTCANKRKGISSKSDLNTFISKANEVHNNFYDYSVTEYKNSKSKVCIICPRHGAFWQSPNAHLHGYGCNECGREKTLESHKKAQKNLLLKQKKFMETNMIIVKFITKEIIEKYVLFVQNTENFGSHH